MVVCNACFHHCNLSEGQYGLCFARKNQFGKVIPDNYGQLTSLSLDPVEKKPLKHFFPGKKILSVGSYGCNLKCPFCQNYHISQNGIDHVQHELVASKYLINYAYELLDEDNIGIAFTYNEPLCGYEFVRDIAKEAKNFSLKTVLVTNGCFTNEVIDEVLPYIDAMNVDYKGDEQFYKMCNGDHDSVVNFINRCSKKCHIEVTTLIIPGMNDSDRFIVETAKMLKKMNEDIVWHITRFFPCYKMQDKEPTDPELIDHFVSIAKEYLENVYAGNC